ncbi:MAG: pyridoxal-phosphate dependent enzyme [Spirochaetales bacterium]|nr:pyridoxal-phosphate dependent enzyme [Spirochaetales bacterium]
MSFYYKCSDCGKTFDIKPGVYLCPECSRKSEKNRPVRGVLETLNDHKITVDINDSENFIHSFLPVEKEYFPPIPVGNTPLWQPLNLRKKLGLTNLFIKDDTLNPTGSLKDRASYLVAAFAIKHKIDDIVVASTGNAASSMSGVGAAAGKKVKIFIPASAPKAKMVQSLQYGADVNLVEGTYDMAFDQSIEYTNKNGGLNRNTAYNPLTLDGKKTSALEIFLQLEKAPDHVFVPVGDGCILGGLYRGFSDLYKNNYIDKIPVIHSVQAEGSCAINRALSNGDFSDPIPSNTAADSISVDIPRNGYYALKMLQKYSGRAINVTDDEILSAQIELASTTGLFAEPSSASVLAGLLKEKNEIKNNENVVLLVTGNGLKDIDGAMKKLSL